MDVYVLVRYVHPLLAIVAVGFTASYGIWLARAAREPAHLGHVLPGIKVLDDRFANPAYALLLVTGLTLTFIAGIPLTTRWILSALVLYAVLIIVGLAVYTPTLRRQIALFRERGSGELRLPRRRVARPRHGHRARGGCARHPLPDGDEAGRLAARTRGSSRHWSLVTVTGTGTLSG